MSGSEGSVLASFRASRWFALSWWAPIAALVATVLVFAARWLRAQPAVEAWLVSYPGEAPMPGWAPAGIPLWLAWQHFLNLFFMVLIVRTGWQVRTVQRPPAYWTRSNHGLLRTKTQPRKISIHLWLHNALDLLWLLNGLVFVALLFVTGQWVRIVPSSWEVVPNALSAALQYLSFDWPLEDGWTNYNALQQLSYFGVVFLLAPLAVLSGVRLAEFWPAEARLSRIYRIEWARAVHFPVMLLFVLFTLVHVILVCATGTQRNLNHMFAASPSATSWWGVGFLAGGLVLIIAALIAARPVVIRAIAAAFGRVGR